MVAKRDVRVKPERFQQIKELFQAALELNPEARKAFLLQTCAGDEALRAELESLLTAHTGNDSFLEEPVRMEEMPPSDQSPEDPIEGKQFGPYKVLREIGRGGMGVVYLAWDPRLERRLALKALAPSYVGDQKREQRLRREAKAAASLSHDSIARVYALEEFDGRIFIASEFIEGNSLRADLSKGPLALPDVLEVAINIGQGLAAAHQKGIIHRDLKPENIMREVQGGIKILDFGLATLLPHAGGGGERLTESGTILGTPSYMSPEQLRGQEVDPRSDIFTFGTLLYELASGTNPFEARTPLSTIAKVMEASPEPISSFAPAASILDRIIRKCMRKEPENRYQSMHELLVDLEKLKGSLIASIAGSSPGTIDEAGPPRSSLNPIWWVAHQTGVMVFYIFMVYPIWQVKEQVEGVPGLLIFLAVLACAAVNGTWRTHLLFTARFNRGALSTQLRRASRWIRWFDWGFAVSLLIAAVTISSHSHNMAGFLASVACGYPVVFLIVEPTTTQAAFALRKD